MAHPEETPHSLSEDGFFVSINHLDNPAAEKLLDVIVTILAEEYVQTARENPEIFSE